MESRGRPLLALVLLVAGLGLSSCATELARLPVPPPPPAPTEVPPWTPPADAGPAIDADQPVLVGTVIKVTDGDTIRVQLSSGPVSVRFDSIDTPEKDQPWGAEAQRALAARLDGQRVALDVVEQDRYERLVAVVLLGEENINGWMVQRGHAWAYRQYLRDKDYCAWEGIARTTRRACGASRGGLRRPPGEWRQAQRGGTQGFTDYSHETVQNCIASMRKRSSDSAARPSAGSTTTK